MLAIEVTINGHKVAIAGAKDLGVLSGVVSATGVLGPQSAGVKDKEAHHGVTLRVGGLTSRTGGLEDEHLTWLAQELTVGDAVTLRVVETDSPDPHVEESNAGGNLEQISERQMYDFAKSEYERLKDKYEPLGR